ncbi:MAG: hypothetical protein OXJ52_04270 [Oligoflexia bacterium]|nr:hypothetical protein [Oligoflexia bacterium]
MKFQKECEYYKPSQKYSYRIEKCQSFSKKDFQQSFRGDVSFQEK